MIETAALILSYALLHSLWILPLFTILCELVLHCARRASALQRYRFTQAMLFAGASLPTVLGLSSAHEGAEPMLPLQASAVAVESSASTMPWIAWHFVPGTLALIWSAGVFVCLSRLLGGALHLNGIRRRSSPAADDVRQAILGLSQSAGLARAPGVRISEEAEGPFVCGFVKPALILPPSLTGSFDTRQTQLVFRHELGHVHQRDTLALLFESLVRCAYYFNPGAHALLRRATHERERAADEFAAQTPSDRRLLAISLGRLALGMSRARSGYLPTVAAGAVQGSLSVRIRALTDPRSQEARYLQSVRGRLLSGALMSLTLAAGMLAAFTALPKHVHGSISEQPVSRAEGIEQAFERADAVNPVSQAEGFEQAFEKAEAVFDEAERLFDRAEVAFDRGETDRAERIHAQAEAVHSRAERMHSRAEALYAAQYDGS